MTKQSEYRNVYWYRTGRWSVKLHIRNNPSGKQTINVGYYDDEVYAARVADLAETVVRGCSEEPNFPNHPLEGAERTEVINALYRLNAITDSRFESLLSGP